MSMSIYAELSPVYCCLVDTNDPLCFISVPYDDNYVALKSPLFKNPPETNYVNASRIKFPGLAQTFIACQAPQPRSFAHFWQMVIEEKVEVIVMVTQLVEAKKVKADQYWPDKDNSKMDLKDGARIELLDTSFQGNYHIRCNMQQKRNDKSFQEVLLVFTRG